MESIWQLYHLFGIEKMKATKMEKSYLKAHDIILWVEKNRQILEAILFCSDFVGKLEGLRLLLEYLGFFALC